MRHRQSKAKNRLCSGKTLRFPRSSEPPKIRGPHSPNKLQGPVQVAAQHHRITGKRHGKNKVNSMRYCVRVEYNGFAAARLKTPQFRQGFVTTCPSISYHEPGGTGISKPTLSREYIYAIAVE